MTPTSSTSEWAFEPWLLFFLSLCCSYIYSTKSLLWVGGGGWWEVTEGIPFTWKVIRIRIQGASISEHEPKASSSGPQTTVFGAEKCTAGRLDLTANYVIITAILSAMDLLLQLFFLKPTLPPKWTWQFNIIQVGKQSEIYRTQCNLTYPPASF